MALAEALPRPRIVCVVDRPGWAHDRKADALARTLADSYELVKRYQAELSAQDLLAADGVLFFYWLQVERLPQLREELRRLRDRVLIGVCSHYELEGSWRKPALAILGELAQAVFVNNRLLFDELGPCLERPLYYTPNGVDTDFFRPPDAPGPSAKLRVGWAGSLANQGAERRGVCEILAPAVNAVTGAELCLAVREERWRTAEEMVDFYHSLDVYVCASRDEGTPNPCLEAAACGVPVVTTRVGNMPELIRDGENGFFIERDPVELAAKLTRLRDEPRMRAAMGRTARAAIAAWDWRLQAERYRPLLAEVVGIGGSGPLPPGAAAAPGTALGGDGR